MAFDLKVGGTYVARHHDSILAKIINITCHFHQGLEIDFVMQRGEDGVIVREACWEENKFKECFKPTLLDFTKDEVGDSLIVNTEDSEDKKKIDILKERISNLEEQARILKDIIEVQKTELTLARNKKSEESI